MSHIVISSDEQETSTIESDGSMNSTTDNKQHLKLMIKLCKNNKWVPQKYIDDINNMYKKCSDQRKRSKKLCILILKGTENISLKNKNSFQYVAEVYNELLQLSKMDNLQVENCVASTSNNSLNTNIELENEKKNINIELENENKNINIELENENKNINIELDNEKENISLSNKIFNEFIEKCYENKHFPNENIEVVDKLYKSLPPEFVDSKYFILLLKEANQAIWPDSGVSLYSHVEHVYNQLMQFHSSMKVQNKKVTEENKEIDTKKLKKLKKLKIALKAIRKQIKMLDEKEMDVSNEDQFDSNSAYILKDKFEKKIIQIYKKICDLTDEPNFLDEPKFNFKQTSNKLVNKTIETYYNQTKVFPDYFEIYTLLKVLNKKKKLNWTEAQLKSISHDAFLKLGKQLKIKRLNEYFGRLAQEITEKDPAEDNIELKKKLDESNKKFNADLNEVTEKFNNEQDYIIETENSSFSDTDYLKSSEEEECIQYNNTKSSVGQKRKLLNNTDTCNSISSEDECANESQCSNKKFKTSNTISVRRKIKLSDNSDNDEHSLCSKKSIHMKNIGLTPNKSNTVSNKKKTIVENKKVVDEVIKENSNDVINANNSDKNISNSNTVEAIVNLDNEQCSIFTIDQDTRNKNDKVIEMQAQTNEVQKDGNNGDITCDYDINDINITEPEITIHEEEYQPKDIIEINDQDDSDVEITSCDPPKVPTQQSLESFIKAMNFDKKYNWDPHASRPDHSYSASSRQGIPNSTNVNNKLVNCWVMNAARVVQPQRTNDIRNNNPNYTRLQQMTPRMQSTSMIQKSMIQRSKHSTQTTVQNRRNLSNNQSEVQQLTMMTTTTTVQQIVHQSQSNRQKINSSKNLAKVPQTTNSSRTNNKNSDPELIELD